MLRLLFPYILLVIIIITYLYIRHNKLGPVLVKIRRKLFSSYNSDSLVLIVVITAVSYFLGRYELQSLAAAEETLYLGPFTYVYFYGALLLVVIMREAESPALREKGISTPRGFWKWSEVDSYRWSKNVLSININRGKKKRVEAWQMEPGDKKEIELILKSNVTRRSKQAKKKTP